MALSGDIYDVVLWSRFDVSARTYSVSFDPLIGQNTIVSAKWNQLNAGLIDHWFYGPPSKMSIFIDMYTSLENDLCGITYQELLRNWPMSSESDEFSNEIFRKGQNVKLKSYDVTCKHLCNSHLLHKFYMIKTNQLNDIHFI